MYKINIIGGSYSKQVLSVNIISIYLYLLTDLCPSRLLHPYSPVAKQDSFHFALPIDSSLARPYITFLQSRLHHNKSNHYYFVLRLAFVTCTMWINYYKKKKKKPKTFSVLKIYHCTSSTLFI